MRPTSSWTLKAGMLPVALLLAATCMRQTQVEAAQPKAPPVRTGAQAQVGSLANVSTDYDQIGNHYQTTDPKFWVRPGFKVTLVASGLGNARFLAFDDKGNLYLSRPDQQDVLVLRRSGAGYKVANTFVANLPQVQGLCWKDGWMWMSQSTSILKARDTNGDGKADEQVYVLKDLAGGSGHWWRSILVTDNAIYSSVGDPSNISDQTSTDREKIFRFNLDGSGKRLFASGLRNTEKLQLRPGTDEVWGGDQGSDWFGAPYGDRQGRQPITDMYPPDEFNHYVEGGFYGHPFLVGNRIPRAEFSEQDNLIDLADKTIPPAWCFGPHWAVDGFTFYTGNGFPAEFKGDAFCGLHGSWNRTVRSGYRIERICFDKVTGVPYGSQLIVGCLSPEKNVLARPVDVVETPEGSLLFSSDSNQSIYEITYSQK